MRRLQRRIPGRCGEWCGMTDLLHTLKLTALIVGPAVPLALLLYLPVKR